MVRDGNLTNIPVEVTDIMACFDIIYNIYGAPVASIRWKTTAIKSVNIKEKYDLGLKAQ